MDQKELCIRVQERLLWPRGQMGEERLLNINGQMRSEKRIFILLWVSKRILKRQQSCGRPPQRVKSLGSRTATTSPSPAGPIFLPCRTLFSLLTKWERSRPQKDPRFYAKGWQPQRLTWIVLFLTSKSHSQTQPKKIKRINKALKASVIFLLPFPLVFFLVKLAMQKVTHEYRLQGSTCSGQGH